MKNKTWEERLDNEFVCHCHWCVRHPEDKQVKEIGYNKLHDFISHTIQEEREKVIRDLIVKVEALDSYDDEVWLGSVVALLNKELTIQDK